VIGTGIFTLTGIEARESAGPGVVISFAIAGVVALLAALCYAELASSVPTAGSAYTYAYATLGELVAWIIGWDLLLEFALGAAVVARGWSGYLAELFDLPTAWFGEEGSIVNVGAIAVVLILGVVAIIGVRESARVTNLLVLVKVAVCVFVVAALLRQGANLSLFIPPAELPRRRRYHSRPPSTLRPEPSIFGLSGAQRRRGGLLRVHRLRGGGEPRRGDEEAAPTSRSVCRTLPISTVLYIGVRS
jgi:APA family basic amino acid/polyamine antiporter